MYFVHETNIIQFYLITIDRAWFLYRTLLVDYKMVSQLLPVAPRYHPHSQFFDVAQKLEDLVNLVI